MTSRERAFLQAECRPARQEPRPPKIAEYVHSSRHRLQLQLGRAPVARAGAAGDELAGRPSLTQVAEHLLEGIAADRAGRAPLDVERAQRERVEAGRLVGGEELEALNRAGDAGREVRRRIPDGEP